MEASQQDNSNNHPEPLSQNNTASLQDPDPFAFLKSDDEDKSSRSSPSFFSENGLGQDIIQVTGAEPDVCLEISYALYHTLRPQIEKQSDVSFKDAWIRFIGGSIMKGTLCPPEKLIAERRTRDIKRILSEEGGETQIFHDLDQVMKSISDLKQKITKKILHKKEIIASLDLVQEFYLRFRNQIKGYIQVILEKEQMNVLYTSESDALEDLLEPKAVMMSDIVPNHWAFRISRNRARKLLSLDMFGRNIKSNNLNDLSNHRVIALPEKTSEPLVFFKANGPIQPEKEFMLYSLYRHLQIPVPETALLILTDVFEANPNYFYAVQASEAVLGESSLLACQDPETIFDHEAYVSQTIGAFLTNPSDGSFKNFKYSPEYKTLVSIDNDLVFKPELTGKDNKKIVNVKSILYISPQIDLPIPESPKTFFTTLDPDLTALSWLQDLSKKNREYQLLFTRLSFQRARCVYQNLTPQSEAPSLASCLQQKVSVDPELHGESFYPQIFVSTNLLNSFTEKLQIIEKILLNNRAVNTQALFEEISPALGKYYRKLRNEFSNPEEALEAVWGVKKNDIDYSYISSFVDHEEFSSLLGKKTETDENLTTPETFFRESKERLISGQQSPLDKFIRRHQERKKKNALNLRAALNELKLLRQEGLTHSQSPRDIVDFCHILSKMIGSDHQLLKEIISLLSSLPDPELKWLFSLEKHFLRPDRHVPKDLIASSVEVVGAFMKKRTLILSKSENQYLFDQQGNIKRNLNLTGRSCVTCFPEENPEFFLKQYPEWPGYEFASTLFMRLLGITQLPYQDLLIMNSSPILLTQKVSGSPVLRIWHGPQAFHNLDPFHTGLLIIAAMLINPEDGKEDNFILSPDGKYLIPIDNDHCFLPSTFQKQGSIWNAFTVNTALQTKTLLFCLDEMLMPIPLEVRQQILSINFDLLLTKWMSELEKIENRIKNLVGQQQQNQFLEQGTVMRIPFYKQFIQNIHWKAHKIKNILSLASQITPVDLLRAVEPFAAKCYENSFNKRYDLQSRFKAATNQLYTKTAVNGSRVSILNTRNMMEIINVSEKDLQNDAIFQKMGPLDALELLNRLIQEHPEKVRREQEMVCELDEEKQEKKFFNLFGNPPAETALKTFFKNPKEGLILKNSNLITSSRLTELFTQAPPHTGTKIRFLSLPESHLLTDKEIRILIKECPSIEYLNVSSCLKLKQIIATEGEWPLLARLEANDCLNLEKIVSYSPMKILRVETDQEIEIFVEKPTLDIFTISKKKIEYEFSFKKGENLEIMSQGLFMSNHSFFICIIRGKEEIERYFRSFKVYLQIPSILSIESLRVFINFLNLNGWDLNTKDIQRIVQLSLINFMSLDLSENPMIGPESLKYLIQGKWPKLNHLDLSKNPQISDEGIEILSQGNWPLLEILNLSNTNISARGVEILVKKTNWPQLKDLDLSENGNEGLETLSNANWPLLETLHLNDSQISKKSFFHFIVTFQWSNLKKVYFDSIGKTTVSNLLPKNWHLLQVLDLKSAEITQTEIEVMVKRCNWPQLLSLDLANNPIDDEALAILCQGNWPQLRVLGLDGTLITKKALKSFILHTNWPNFKTIILPKFWSPADQSLVQNFIKKDLSQIQHLVLDNCAMTLDGLEAVFHKYKCPRPQHLNISHNSLTLEEISDLILADCPLLEELHLENIKMTSKGIESIARQTKWQQLKHLNISNNNILDEGLSAFSVAKWPLLKELNLKNTKITSYGIELLVHKMHLPNLKKLDISENDIFDKGFEILASGKWPLFEHLVFYRTKVTSKVTINLLENLSAWPNLQHLEQSLEESIYSDIENLQKIILAMVPMYFRGNPMLVTVLNKTWLNSKEISLSVQDHNERKRKTMILPRNQLDQFYHIRLSSLNASPIQFIKLPPNLKTLYLHGITFSDKEKSSPFSISSQQCLLMETFCFGEINMEAQDIQTLISRSEWPNLKQFYLSSVRVKNEELDIFTSAKWPLLEHLHLNWVTITAEDFGLLVQKSNWPKLKKLDLTGTQISNQKVEALASAKWPLLEHLSFEGTTITGKSLEILRDSSERAKWPKLKEFRISWQGNQDEGLKILSRHNWPHLETLYYLNYMEHEVSDQGLEALAAGKWPSLKYLYIFGLHIKLKKLKALVKTAFWPSLNGLYFVSNDTYKDAEIQALKELVLEKWPGLDFGVKSEKWKLGRAVSFG